jgi:hypothetical protein
VKVIIEIPIECYLLLMTRFGVQCPQYLMLKNGVITHEADDKEVVEVRCDSDCAKLVLEKVANVCPEVLLQIQHRLDLP